LLPEFALYGDDMRVYFSELWKKLKGLFAAIRGKAPAGADSVEGKSRSAYDSDSVNMEKVHELLRSRHEIDCVRAYFRSIGVILRYKRWMKPGEPMAHQLREALQLFPAVEWQYAECGFRPMMPLNRLFEMSEEPAVVVSSGFVIRRGEGEEPIFYARALMRQIEKLAAKPVSAAGLSATGQNVSVLAHRKAGLLPRQPGAVE